MELDLRLHISEQYCEMWDIFIFDNKILYYVAKENS